MAKVGGAAERGGLAAGQRGAAGSQSGVMAWVGQGDGDRIEGPFHDDGRSAAGQVTARLVKPEQQVTFLIGAGRRSVQIFRYGGTSAGAGAADEPGEVPVLVVDRQHDPIPEVIEERSA